MKHLVLSSKPPKTHPRQTGIFKRIIASLAVTGVVIGGFVIFKPTTATADILTAEADGQDVYYEVLVTDEDHTLAEGTLMIIAENSFDRHEQPLIIGLQSGVFMDLKPNTMYTLSVVGNSGFGVWTISSTVVTTSE